MLLRCVCSADVHPCVASVQVTRRAWAGHKGAQYSIHRAMDQDVLLRVTECQNASDDLLASVVPGDAPGAGAGAGTGAGAGAGSAQGK